MASFAASTAAFPGRSALALLLLAAVATAGCRGGATTPAASTAVSPDTWAVVDGHQITRDELEKAYRRVAQTAATQSPEEQLTAKLTLLNDYIVQEILLAKARALNIVLPDTELDAAYADAKKNISDAAFQEELSKRNLTAADMREGLRRELLAQKVIEREVVAKVAVSEQEVTDFFNANRAQFNFPEEAFHLAQIVVTPVRDRVANQTGDDAGTPQAAAAKTQMLMERLKGGAAFPDLARDYSEDPESAPRGGDLGFVPLSALKQAPPPLRDAVLNLTPGSVRVVSQGGGHAIVLLVAREAAGQRDLSTPAVRENITNALKGRKEQLLRTAYLSAARSDARIENYLARRVVEAQGKVPSLGPAAPAAPAAR
jgi:peptidyl-prolyl cis-trans isomerase SurA